MAPRNGPNNPNNQGNARNQKNQAPIDEDIKFQTLQKDFFKEKVEQTPNAFLQYFPNNTTSFLCQNLEKEFNLFVTQNNPIFIVKIEASYNTPEKKQVAKNTLINNFRQYALAHYVEKKQITDTILSTIKNKTESVSTENERDINNALAVLDNDALKKISQSDTAIEQFLHREKIQLVLKEKLDIENTLNALSDKKKAEAGEDFRELLEKKDTTLADVTQFLQHLPAEVQLSLIKAYQKPIKLWEIHGENIDEELVFQHIIKKSGLDSAQLLKKDYQVLKSHLLEIPLTLEDLLIGQSIEDALINNTVGLQKILQDISNTNAELNNTNTAWTKSHKAFLAYIAKEIPNLKNSWDLRYANSVIKTRFAGVSKAQWFQITETDKSQNREKGVLLKNITAPIGGVYLNGAEEFVSYKDFFDFLSLASKEADDCVIESAQNFGQQIKTESIKTVVDAQDIITKEELTRLLDLSDSSGKKFGIKEGTCFAFDGNNNTDGIARITHIGDTIRISNAQGDNTFTFAEFYGSFMHANGRRVASITEPNDILKALQDHPSQKVKNSFGKLAYKNGSFIDKYTQGNEKPEKVNYLINKKSGKAIFIENISNWQVKCKTGKWSAGKNNTGDVFSASEDFMWIPLENFYWYTSQNELEPEVIKNPESLGANVNMASNEWNNNLMQRWLSGMSYMSMIKGSKHWVKAIEAHMKEWTELNAAKFARTLGKFLPSGMASQLDSAVGSEEKKLREAFSGRLKKLDQVYAILGDRSAQDYKVEAALLFVMKENGTLYPEKEFSGIKGQFKWYERFGGKRKDALFMSHMEKCANATSPSGEPDPQPFLEENLLIELLAQQEKNGVRQGRFSKEFAKSVGEGYKKIKTDTEERVAGENRPQDKEAVLLKALGDNKVHGAAGGLNKLLSGNGAAADMGKLPFIMTITGMTQRLDEASAKDYAGNGKNFPYTALLFGKNNADIELFRRVCISLAETISTDAAAAAKLAAKDGANDAAEKFWDKYGTEMTKKLMICGDPTIFLKKDTNPDYKEYYGRVKKNIIKMEIREGELWQGVFNNDNASLFMFGGEDYLAKTNFTFLQNGNLKNATSEKMLEEALKDISALKKQTCSIEEKKKLYTFQYIAIAKVFATAIGAKKEFDNRYYNNPYCSKLREKYGIEIPYSKADIDNYTDTNPDLMRRINASFDTFINTNEVVTQQTITREKVSAILRRERTTATPAA